MNTNRLPVPSSKSPQSNPHGLNEISGLLCRLALAALFALACLAPARGQVSASITGMVTDASGAPVPAASVKTKSLETGATRDGVTDGVGRYL
ncbi:MAG TPA: carboxypeptidase-like regulatory domain-containing protein, partial [Candidatus Acidoferrum sp.]|nr:carboxypeptidase-like regulatory domain-containing protein [Candidatus Acidoferrum sp.]